MKRSALVGLKLAVSLALLAYLFSVTDTQRARGAGALGRPPAAGRGRGLLPGRCSRSPPGAGACCSRRSASTRRCAGCFQSYLVATFFNNFLPSNIGGDVVRVRDGSRLTGSTAASLAVVGIDRILGFGALYVLAATAFLLGGPVERGLAGARVVLGGLRDRVPRCSATSSSGPARPARSLAASRLDRIPWVLAQFESAQGAVQSYRQSVGSVDARARREPRDPDARRLVLRVRRPRAAHSAAGDRRVPDGPALHAAAGRADLVQRLGAARGALHRVLRAGRPAAARAASPSRSWAPA